MWRYFASLAVGASVAATIGNAWGVPIGLYVHFALFRCWIRPERM